MQSIFPDGARKVDLFIGRSAERQCKIPISLPFLVVSLQVTAKEKNYLGTLSECQSSKTLNAYEATVEYGCSLSGLSD